MMAPSSTHPRVSIAIPAYNAERWIGEAVESALGQSFDDLEVVVLDDGSSDETAAVVAGMGDPRLRLFRNATNLGQSVTWNLLVSLCRAPLIKFLCADDLLHVNCVAQMVPLFDRSPSVGLVFTRREVVFLEPQNPSPELRRAYRERHLGFGRLEEVNSGRRLFEAYLAAGFEGNWIGEPTNVMIRRTLFERISGFRPYIRQAVDLDLWVRAMIHTHVGFVDEPLATYRVGVPGSVTQENFRDGRLWVERLVFLESLLADAEIRSGYPEIKRMARRERLRCLARFAKVLVRSPGARDRLREGRLLLDVRRPALVHSSGPVATRPPEQIALGGHAPSLPA
jgi:glycosyltransferase involved in cell wall biosynthesis